MTGSPIFKFTSNLTKKQKIQRKLNFVRDVPRNPLRLHIDNLLAENERANDSQDGIQATKPTESASSLSSFVFEHKRGVKRKLDFDADDVSDEVSSFRFSNKNISLNGFHSRNSSLGDIKSITLSPNKNRYRRSSCTRSSAASTCRRRLFPDAEPDPKKPKLESPVLCPRPKRKEIKLSLKKKFPGVPNSDAARSGLLLNLAFSKYNMLNNDKEQNVSVDFVDEKTAKSSSKNELLQYSSIKKDHSAFHYSPVFKAIKKVKRKLNLEEQDTTNKSVVNTVVEMGGEQTGVAGTASVSSLTVDADISRNVPDETAPYVVLKASVDTGTARKEIENESEQRDVPTLVASSPTSVKTHRSPTKYKNELFKNSRLRPTLRDEIFNLSKPGADENVSSTTAGAGNTSVTERRCDSSNRRPVLPLARNSSGYVKMKPKYDRIVVSKDTSEDRNSSRTDGENSSRLSRGTESVVAGRSVNKRWFDDSFHKGRRSDLRKSLFYRRRDAFVDSHIQRFLNDCVHAAAFGGRRDSLDSQISCDANDESGLTEESNRNDNADKIFVIEDVESPDGRKLKEPNATMTRVEGDVAVRPILTSPIIESMSRLCSVQSNSENVKRSNENNPLRSDKTSDVFNDFIIEDSTSQEINKHCVEEVELVIDSPGSRDGVAVSLETEWHVADNSLPGMRRSPTFKPSSVNDTLNAITIEEESANGCSQNLVTMDPDLQVEEVLSSESISHDVHFTESAGLNATPSKDITQSKDDVTFDSEKKFKRKKFYTDSLVSRLQKLLCREKSDLRMWEYEMSKKVDNSDGPKLGSASFCVQKMWKEFSKLILLCAFANQDVPDSIYKVSETKKFGFDISNTVLLIMDESTVPKALTYTSVFRVYPPWNILHSENSDCVIILRPCRVDVISKDIKPPSVDDQMLPEILAERQFCSCSEACNCTLPEGYQTVIQPILYSCSHFMNFKNFRWRNCDEEYFARSRSLSDVVLKYKLFSSENVFHDLRVLHFQRNFVCNDCILWNILCVDDRDEICCIVMEDEMKANFPVADDKWLFRFWGILPWKRIPADNVLSFIDHVELNDVSRIKEPLGTTSLYIFVMSKKHGRIERLAEDR